MPYSLGTSTLHYACNCLGVDWLCIMLLGFVENFSTKLLDFFISFWGRGGGDKLHQALLSVWVEC
jgi:hypothetical protein